MTPEHEKFILEESTNISGQRWLGVFKALTDTLYSSRNKSLDKVQSDQGAAQVIEQELIQRLELGAKPLKPQKGDEYS